MSSWTLQEAKEMLSRWLDAERAITTGQSYQIGTRQLRRADMKEVADRIKWWRAEVYRIEHGQKPGLRAFRAVPRDL